LGARYPEAQVVDANDCVITPAFTNAHHHMYGVLAHGIPLDRAPAGFWPFLEDFWWPLVEDQLSHELIAAATDWACLEMVRSGVTTFYDCLEAPNALPGALEVEAEVVRRWGLRGVLSFEATQRVSDENGELGLRENADFYDACRARGDLVSGLICFHTTFTCSETFIRRAFALAAEREAKVHMHLSEGTYEPDYCLANFGRRTVAHYDHLGLLGPHVLASQCVQVDADEIDILARRGVHVSHQPLSNCEVGGGFAPLPEMLAAGVNVALGTDGYINNFFEVMRAAALLPKARLLDPGVVPAAEAWTMATQNGARALGFDDLGTLAPGKQADLLLIGADLPSPLAPHPSTGSGHKHPSTGSGHKHPSTGSGHKHPSTGSGHKHPSTGSGHNNTADQLLLWRNPADLRGVMCAGQWLLWDGQIVGQDPEAIRERVVAAAAHLWQA
jgi:cytosine/adenosine deaminase-related metal-dependent hydrolase